MSIKSMANRVTCLATCLLVCVSANAGEVFTDEGPAPGEYSAEEIIEASVATYLDCDSYRDKGVVTTTLHPGDSERIERKPFKTSFSRTGQFRFEFESRGVLGLIAQRYIVWTDGTEVLTWWDVKPGVEREETLSTAVAGATGVSGRSAHTIPVLLLPDRIGGRRLSDMTDLVRADDTSIGDIDCYCVQGKYGGQRKTVWIDKTTHLIRRIDLHVKTEDLQFETTTTYDAAVNTTVSAADLAFNPPTDQ